MKREEQIKREGFSRYILAEEIDAFVDGALWADQTRWHKFSDEYPKEAAWYFVQVQVGSKLIYEVALFDLTYGWLCRTEYDCETDVKYWLEIPEIKED